MFVEKKNKTHSWGWYLEITLEEPKIGPHRSPEPLQSQRLQLHCDNDDVEL